MKNLLRPLLLAALLLPALPALAELRVTDITGREVVLDAPAQRIVLAEARHMAVLGMLHDDPVALVAGWRQNKMLDDATLAAYRQKFPAIDAIRSVGSGNRDLSAETIIALAPDLVVLPLADARDEGLKMVRSQLEQAGIAMAYVDFFSHPQENALPSLAILGALTGAEARAQDFTDFYQSRLTRIRERLAEADPDRPDVFFHVHALASECCATAGTGIFHDFIETAGGRNLGSAVVPGAMGTISLEYLLSRDPDFYIATGGTHMAQRGGLVLGAGVDAQTAQRSFEKLIAAPGFSALSAVDEGRAAGVWHMFNNSPSHIVLIEYLAKTFHPGLFTDVDPAATLAEITARFSPVDIPGTYWVTPSR